MTKHFRPALLGVAVLAAWAGITIIPAYGDVLYQQNVALPGEEYASLNYIGPGGLGNIFTVYDNFTLDSTSIITSVDWLGGYFGSGTITGWTLNFYANNAGQPGTLVASTGDVAGTGDETLLPTGFYAYSLATNFTALAGTEYWLSVVADVGFPLEWGWATGTGGDGISYQDIFGSLTRNPVDMAFTLNSSVATPEPSSLLLLAIALVALVPVVRKELI